MTQLTSPDTVNTVRTFWYGSQLSAYELLSLSSFLKHGHEVELYSYDSLKVPEGVRLHDAREILPQSEVFTYASGPAKGGVNAFSDLFRYALLYQKGGIWVDTDVLCLRSFATLPISCVGLESEKDIAIGVMKFLKQDPICEELYCKAKAFDRKQITWSEMGPQLLTSVLRNKNSCHVLPPSAFYPVPSLDAWKLIDPSRLNECEELAGSAYCVHWWSEILRQIGLPKQALPPKGSYLYQQAQMIMDCEGIDVWPEPLVSSWIKNYRASQLLSHPDLDRPITALLKSQPQAIVKDLVSILQTVKRRIKRA